MSYSHMDISTGLADTADMTSRTAGRGAFPLRFRDPETREALRRMAELTGQPMTVIAEQAIEHEVTLRAADLERRLEDALEVVRGYSASRNLDAYLDAAAAGENSDLGAGLRAVAVHADLPAAGRQQHSAPALEVLASFARS